MVYILYLKRACGPKIISNMAAKSMMAAIRCHKDFLKNPAITVYNFKHKKERKKKKTKNNN